MVVSAFQETTGIAVSPMAKEQLLLPTRFGGLGLDRSARQCAAAYVGFRLAVPPAVWQATTLELDGAVTNLCQQALPTTAQAKTWLVEAIPFLKELDPEYGFLRW